MAKIAVDIDDTLYSFSAIAKDALFHLAQERDDKDILNAAYTESLQWRTPADVAGLDIWMEAIEMAHQPEVIAEQPPYPGAAKTLNALVDEGHELMYISNRDEKALEATGNWLYRNGFPCEYTLEGDDLHRHKVELKCLWGDKIPHLKDHQYIIDDRVSTLVRFVTNPGWLEEHTEEEPRVGFSIQHSHNTNLTDVPNIYLAPSWAGLNYYLVRKGLLSELAYNPFVEKEELIISG